MAQNFDIKINRNVEYLDELKREIFVTEPGAGGNRCLMGIHQIGKTTLVNDWRTQWSKERIASVNAFKTDISMPKIHEEIESLKQAGNWAEAWSIESALNQNKEKEKYISQYVAETPVSIAELPEMAKIFYFGKIAMQIGFWTLLKELLNDIMNKESGVLIPVRHESKEIVVKKNDEYLIRTGDGFLVSISNEDEKKALDTILDIYSYFEQIGNFDSEIASNEIFKEVSEGVITLFKAFSVLGFHLILVFDEFNNSQSNRHGSDFGKRSRRREKSAVVEKESYKEAFFQLLRSLAACDNEKRNLSVLLISRQEFGMITGRSSDDELFKPANLDGFSNKELMEFISRLSTKENEEKNNIPYSVLKEYWGDRASEEECQFKKKLIHFCGRHPGLWGNMWSVLKSLCSAISANQDADSAFEIIFQDYNNNLFASVLSLMQETEEKIIISDSEVIEENAFDIFVQNFVKSYAVYTDELIMESCLKRMLKQGFISKRRFKDSFIVLEKKAESGENLDSDGTAGCVEIKGRPYGYESLSSYFVECVEKEQDKLFYYDMKAFENVVEKCEKQVRKLIEEVYVIKFGSDKWKVKLKNRMTSTKKGYWEDEIKKQYVHHMKYTEGVEISKESVTLDKDKEAIAWEHSSALNTLSFHDYSDLMLSYVNVFTHAFKNYVTKENDTYKFNETYSKIIDALTDLRNSNGHLNTDYLKNEKVLADKIAMCSEFLNGIEDGWDDVIKCAQNSKTTNKSTYIDTRIRQSFTVHCSTKVKEQILDLFSIDFQCNRKYQDTAEGEIWYDRKKYKARLRKTDVLIDNLDSYYDRTIQERSCIKVDVVECIKNKNDEDVFIIQPIDRSGLMYEWR